MWLMFDGSCDDGLQCIDDENDGWCDDGGADGDSDSHSGHVQQTILAQRSDKNDRKAVFDLHMGPGCKYSRLLCERDVNALLLATIQKTLRVKTGCRP